METRKITFIIVGSLLVVLNILSRLVSPIEYMDGNTAYNIGSFIGAHIFLLVGVLLLWRAYKIHRRIKNAKKTSLLQQDIERIGSHQ